ncbi:hypothetical protein HKCCSP123_06180 [Rhodobacterales bacterium HKCCSP123]|nr:hypothetical protein [Rhodobacterales bacterium HKCCSP123]
MNDAQIDEFVHFHARRLIDEGDNWQRRFVFSILKAVKRPGWRPTPKQARVMQGMMADLSGEVVEDE